MIKLKRDKLFLLAILLVGLLTVIPYGAFLDQSTEQVILYSNIKEYLLHLPGDTPQLVQDLTDYGVERISVSIDRYNGMAVYYPAFPIWYLNQVSPYIGNICWHAYIFLLVFWGICSLFLLAKELSQNEKVAAFTALLFFLTPRMFAESHYNNKDIVLLSLTFVTLYWGRRLLKDKSMKTICMFAFAGALAANMKIIGAWIFGILGLYVLFTFLLTKQFNKKMALKTFACIGLWVLIYILITPACWGDLTGFINFLVSCATDFRWNDYILFNGDMYNKDYTGMPRKYLPVMMLLTIPVGILLLAVLGGSLSVVDLIRKKGRDSDATGYVLVSIIVGAVPLLYAVLSGTPVYNGWRHFYFVYASIIMAAGYGAWRLWQLIKEGKPQKGLEAAAACYVGILALGIAVNYPQEHSFYNVLAGTDIEEKYELDYWDMSVKQALEIIVKDTDAEQIQIGALNLPTMWGLEENMLAIRGKSRMRIVLSEEWQQADYVIINTTYAHMYSGDGYAQVRAEYELIESISSYGNTICEIYKK